jgi:hypothetical protein
MGMEFLEKKAIKNRFLQVVASGCNVTFLLSHPIPVKTRKQPTMKGHLCIA